VIYGEGVSDKPLTVEVYKGNRLIALLNGDLGIQSNYKIEDTDGDGKKRSLFRAGSGIQDCLVRIMSLTRITKAIALPTDILLLLIN